jgi:hypothetical protein
MKVDNEDSTRRETSTAKSKSGFVKQGCGWDGEQERKGRIYDDGIGRT